MRMLISRLVSMAVIMVTRAVFHGRFWSFRMITVPIAMPMNSGRDRTIVFVGLAL